MNDGDAMCKSWQILKATPFETQQHSYPWTDLTFSQIKNEMSKIKKEYPDYSDFVWEENYKSLGYGAMTYWFELKGYKNDCSDSK